MDYLKKIKKITNQCIAKKWIDRSPFVGFKMSVNETHKTFLNEEELMLIAEQKITIKRLEQVRDIFLFSCYTGLSYCDVAKLTTANVVNGVDGDKWIFTVGRKRIHLRRSHCCQFRILSLINMSVIFYSKFRKAFADHEQSTYKQLP